MAKRRPRTVNEDVKCLGTGRADCREYDKPVNSEFTINSGIKLKLPNGWQVRPIESLCLRVTSGGTPLRSNPAFYESGTIPWIKTKELKDWYIDDSEEKITPVALEKSSAKLFPSNTVLMAMYGDGRTITSLGILRNEAATNQACCALIVNPDICGYLYLFYSLKYHRNDFIHLASGGAQRNLSGLLIRDFAIKVPPLETQRKIIEVLSAYDDLIENNTRRIKILEEMAQALYREWFVKFRFPGHEKVKMVESELGMVPEGWEMKKVAELCYFVSRGVTPKYSQGSCRYIINQKANRGSNMELAELKELHPDLMVPDEKLAHRGDLLVNCLGEGTIGRVHYFTGLHKKWAVDQHMAICRSVIPGNTNYLYWVLSSADGQAKIQSLKTGGTNMTMLNISALRDFTVIYPRKELLGSFDNLTEPIWNMRQTLEGKNLNLRRTRDLLLPKLISGEVDVKKIDVQMQDRQEKSSDVRHLKCRKDA